MVITRIKKPLPVLPVRPFIITHDINHIEWYSVILEKIYNTYRSITGKIITIKRDHLQKILPKHFIGTDVRMAKFNEIFIDKNVTEKQFIKFISFQTTTSDYISFDYLIRYYKTNVNENWVPIFTSEWKFDNTIKKEALYVWTIDRYIRNHPEFKDLNSNYFEFELQSTLELNSMTNVRKMKYDIKYIRLGIIIEIDENHNGSHLLNDDVKNAIMAANGIVFIRLNHQKIHEGEILNGENISEKVRVSKYTSDFLEELAQLVTNSLLHKYLKAREHFIMIWLKKLQRDEIDKFQSLVVKYHRNLNALKNIDLSDEQSEINICKKLITNTEFNLSQNILYLTKAKTCLASLEREIIDEGVVHEKSDFIELYLCKELCTEINDNGDYIDKKVIDFFKISKILDIMPESYADFKIFLHSIGAIEDLLESDDEIFINWEHIKLIVFGYISNVNVKDQLQYYTLKVETNYERILKYIEIHNKRIRGSPEIYQKVMVNACVKYKEVHLESLAREAVIMSETELAKKISTLEKKIKLDQNKVAAANKEAAYYKKLYEGSKEYDFLVSAPFIPRTPGVIIKPEEVLLREKEVEEILVELALARSMENMRLCSVTSPNTSYKNSVLSERVVIYASDDDEDEGAETGELADL